MPGPLRWLVARQSKTKLMLDPDTFLTTLYVTCDDFFQGEDQTVDALPCILDHLLNKGFTFVTVSQLKASLHSDSKSQIE